MKKYAILTSVLALAACGGGGGSGGIAMVDNAPRAATVLGTGVTDSNSEITSMASAIIVKNGGGYSNIARAASAPDTTTYAGYTVYKLDNVDFKLIDDEGSTNFNFNIAPNGRIESASANGQTVARDTTDTSRFYGKTFQLIDSDVSPDAEVRVLIKTPTTSQQDLDNARDAYLAEKLGVLVTDLTADDRATTSWNYLEQLWNFESEAEQGLTYSDFGTFSASNVVKMTGVSIDANGHIDGDTPDSDHESHMIFSGGYAIDGTNLSETLVPQTGASYTGKAIGIVTTSIKCTGGDCSVRPDYLNTYNIQKDEDTNGDNVMDSYSNDAGLDMTQKFVTNKAQLVIQNDGTQKLTMPFNTSSADANKFYDVEITMNEAGDSIVGTPTFKDNNPGGTSMATNMYRVDTGVTPAMNVTSGFYGINSATEATGAVRYYTEKTMNEDTNIKREFEFQGAWGMKPGTPTNN